MYKTLEAVAGHTGMRQGVSRRLYPNRQWSAGDCFVWSAFMDPKGVLRIVSKARGNALGQGSPEVSANLEIFSLRVPLVLLTLKGPAITPKCFARPSLRVGELPSEVGSSITGDCGMCTVNGKHIFLTVFLPHCKGISLGAGESFNPSENILIHTITKTY